MNMIDLVEERRLKNAREQTGPLAGWQLACLIRAGDIKWYDPEPEKDYSKDFDNLDEMSWGITQHGIDLRCDSVWRRPNMVMIDELIRRNLCICPQNIRKLEKELGMTLWHEPIDIYGGIVLEPGDSILGQTKECISIPNDCTGILQPRSTWLRFIMHVFSSPIEAGWEGRITLEIVNLGKTNLAIYPHQGIVQLQFFRGGLCEDPYAGKYQNQMLPTPPLMLETK